MQRHRNLKIVYLELGVGYNTPVIIKYPFWQYTSENPKATYICINREQTIALNEFSKQTIDVINNITGECYSMNLTLAYDGEFGFTAFLTINMDKKNAGLCANLFYFNEQAGKLEFICTDEIDAGGNTRLAFTHASDYIVVVDDKVMDSEDTNVANADLEKENWQMSQQKRNFLGLSSLFLRFLFFQETR